VVARQHGHKKERHSKLGDMTANWFQSPPKEKGDIAAAFSRYCDE
jgi:hypothetical protein